ncbi:MAG: hypothetical protein HZT40_08045 [Candidatus Thiothrix singaporensis]|uniref:Uncharacterized protein n=1 Tax=Candidatus Thiothrix singaporensis TaxID=2799669 RepID=A0A7L6AR14_9GAMM|nr:MAG: hypothetical protein HZT40_08045 [Candidatus Thiothrix singaporensis]
MACDSITIGGRLPRAVVQGFALPSHSSVIYQDVEPAKCLQQALHQRLQRAQQEGDLPSTADSAVLAAYVMTISQGMAVQAKAGTRKALEKLVDYVLSSWPAPPH